MNHGWYPNTTSTSSLIYGGAATTTNTVLWRYGGRWNWGLAARCLRAWVRNGHRKDLYAAVCALVGHAWVTQPQQPCRRCGTSYGLTTTQPWGYSFTTSTRGWNDATGT